MRVWYCRVTMRTDEGGITEYGGGDLPPLPPLLRSALG